MNDYQRIFKETISGLVEISDTVNDISDDCEAVSLAPGHFLYILNAIPFPSRIFKFKDGIGNSVAAKPVVEYYSGKKWLEFVDVRDGTNSLAASFSKDGCITWCIDCKSWCCIDCGNDGFDFEPFKGLQLCECMYFTRIGFDKAVNFDLQYIGPFGCTEAAFCALYPTLNNQEQLRCLGLKDWCKQIQIASFIIEDHLFMKYGKDFYLDINPRSFNLATVHLTAYLIYGLLEKDKLADHAYAEYTKVLDRAIRKTAAVEESGPCLSNTIFQKR